MATCIKMRKLHTHTQKNLENCRDKIPYLKVLCTLNTSLSVYTELTVGQQSVINILTDKEQTERKIRKLTPMSRELSTWIETYDALMPFTQLIVMLFVLFLSSSPDSQNVSVEPSVRLPIMAGRLDVLMSTTLVRSFRQVTTQSSCNICKMKTLNAI